MSESQLKEKIGDWLTSRHFFFRRFAGSVFMRSGIPDFFVLLPGGKAVWIEVKRPGRYKSVWEGCRKDSPSQYHFIIQVNMQGGLGMIVDSIEEVVNTLAQYA